MHRLWQSVVVASMEVAPQVDAVSAAASVGAGDEAKKADSAPLGQLAATQVDTLTAVPFGSVVNVPANWDDEGLVDLKHTQLLSVWPVTLQQKRSATLMTRALFILVSMATK